MKSQSLAGLPRAKSKATGINYGLIRQGNWECTARMNSKEEL